MNQSNMHHQYFVICEELVESFEQVNENKPYVVVLNSGDIVYKLITPNENNLTLVSTNKEYNPYNISLSKVKQIWKGKYTPDVRFFG
jgi:hypothetical protein